MTTKTMTTADVSLDETGAFLADYTSWLCGCGATCIRIEKNVGRMSEALGVETDVTVMPRHIQLSVREPGGTGQKIFVSPIRKCGINFSLNTALSRLSWHIADDGLGLEAARRMFGQIVSAPVGDRRWILLLASLANASFCRLFGGDAVAMFVVFAGTLIGLLLKEWMLGAGRDVRLTFMCCAFVSASVCAGAMLFGWGTTPEIAMATSVLYLIPGVPYINAASDLMDRHYLCAFSRFVDACVLTACLSIGLCLALALFGLEFF